MAFADALDLRTAVFELVGDTTKADIWPRLVSLAENKINQTLRHDEMVTRANVTIVDNVGDLPADYVEMIALNRGACELTEIELERFDREDFGYCYAVSGGKLYVKGSTTQPITYYAKLPTLANDLAATNWLLNKGPDVYLYAIAAEALFEDIPRTVQMNEAKNFAMGNLKTASNRARYGNSTVTFNDCIA